MGAEIETSEVAFSASGEWLEGAAGEVGGPTRCRFKSGDCSCSTARFTKLIVRISTVGKCVYSPCAFTKPDNKAI